MEHLQSITGPGGVGSKCPRPLVPAGLVAAAFPPPRSLAPSSCSTASSPAYRAWQVTLSSALPEVVLGSPACIPTTSGRIRLSAGVTCDLPVVPGSGKRTAASLGECLCPSWSTPGFGLYYSGFKRKKNDCSFPVPAFPESSLAPSLSSDSLRGIPLEFGSLIRHCWGM